MFKSSVVPVCDVGCIIIIDRSVGKGFDFSATLKLLDMTCYHATYRITGALYHGILVLRKHLQLVCKENCWLKFDTLFQKFEAFWMNGAKMGAREPATGHCLIWFGIPNPSPSCIYPCLRWQLSVAYDILKRRHVNIKIKATWNFLHPAGI